MEFLVCPYPDLIFSPIASAIIRALHHYNAEFATGKFRMGKRQRSTSIDNAKVSFLTLSNIILAPGERMVID